MSQTISGLVPIEVASGSDPSNESYLVLAAAAETTEGTTKPLVSIESVSLPFVTPPFDANRANEEAVSPPTRLGCDETTGVPGSFLRPTARVCPPSISSSLDQRRAKGAVEPTNRLPDVTVKGELGSPDTTSPDSLSHSLADAHPGRAERDEVGNVPTSASLDPVESAQVSHRRSGAPRPAADLALSHSLMGHFARQMADLQQTRQAMGNRIAAMERDGLPKALCAPAQAAYDEVAKAEHALDLQLGRLARKHPLYPWIKEAPGISEFGFARILGATGPLDQFANVAKLWAYLGYHVVEGHAPKQKKGEKGNWSPRGRSVCYQIGESIVKLNRGRYREAYDVKKAYYEAERLDWTQAHRHNAAMRYAVKELLKDMWCAWRDLGLSSPVEVTE